MEPPSQLPTCLTICIAHQKGIRWLLVVLICSVLILLCILIEATTPWKPPPHGWHCPMEATTPWKALPHGSNRKWSSWFWYCCARALLLLASDCTLVSGSYISTYDLKPKIRVFRKSRSVFAQSRMFLETSRRSCFCSIICSFSTHFADTHRKAKFSCKMECTEIMLIPILPASSLIVTWWFCMNKSALGQWPQSCRRPTRL